MSLHISREIIEDAAREWKSSGPVVFVKDDPQVVNFYRMKSFLENLLAYRHEKLYDCLKDYPSQCEKVTECIANSYDQFTFEIMQWAKYYGLWDGISEFPRELLNPFNVDTSVPIENQPYQRSLLN